MTHEIVSIEEIVRRKSYKNSIDKMNVDIKSLINPDVPRYTNLLYAPNSQRLVGRPDLTKELKPLPKTVYLRDEANRAIRTDPPSRRSRENLVRTEVRPTPENSFRQPKEPSQRLAPVLKKSIGREQPESKEMPLVSKEMRMNKTLNAFLFKMELPDNPRVSSCQTKKRIRYIKDSQSNSIDLRVDVSPTKQKSPRVQQNERMQTQQRADRMDTQQKVEKEERAETLHQSRQRPPRPKRQQKIPQFIKINLQIEQQKRKQPPKATVMFAERRVKSVIKFRKRKQQQSGSKSPEKQKPERTNKLREAIAEQYKRFATIQPEVTELKILSKLERKLHKQENSTRELKQTYTRESRRKKRKLLADKLYQGDICGWNNNQENEDHLNLF